MASCHSFGQTFAMSTLLDGLAFRGLKERTGQLGGARKVGRSGGVCRMDEVTGVETAPESAESGKCSRGARRHRHRRHFMHFTFPTLQYSHSQWRA